MQPLLHQQLRIGLHQQHSHSIGSVVLIKKEKRQQKIIRISSDLTAPLPTLPYMTTSVSCMVHTYM